MLEPARYLWAMLLARIYESAPLACRHCGADMRIIAFVTDSVSVRRVQAHISERVASPNVRYPYRADAEALPAECLLLTRCRHSLSADEWQRSANFRLSVLRD